MTIRTLPALLATASLLIVQPAMLAAQAPAAKPSNAQTVEEKDLPLDPRFSADRVRADVAFLADDLLKGRETGSVEYEIAANYVAQRFASLGLTPFGDVVDGKAGWLQHITFQKTTRAPNTPANVTITGPAGTQVFEHGVDSLVGLNANEPKLDITAPLVFVGYGIENARLGLNDYKGLDVKGKIVVALRGFPSDLPSEEAAHASATKGKAAQEHGAIGIIQIDTNLSAKLRPWARRISISDSESFTWVDKAGKAFDETPGIRISAGADDKAAAAIFAGAPKTVAQLRAEAEKPGARPKGFVLKSSAHIVSSSQAERVSSPNIVAMFPGTDPVLSKEYVILSGHLDHTGVDPVKPGEPADKDRINNGALDNAAGVATLLEVAHVMAQDGSKPRRSVIFLVSTGEEKGLLGAGYYAHNPTAPIAQIVGNVDLDMPVLLYPFNDVTAYGADHSTLGKIVRDAVAPMKVGLAPDPSPGEATFVRSDHYMFVKQGVPAVFLATGYGNGGEAQWEKFLVDDYHQVSDDMKQPINWRAGARFAEANYRITRAIADGDTPPLWLKGDFFGDLFAPSAAKGEAAKTGK